MKKLVDFINEQNNDSLLRKINLDTDNGVDILRDPNYEDWADEHYFNCAVLPAIPEIIDVAGEHVVAKGSKWIIIDKGIPEAVDEDGNVIPCDDNWSAELTFDDACDNWKKDKWLRKRLFAEFDVYSD